MTILRRIKEKFKRAVLGKKVLRLARKASPAPLKERKLPAETRREVIGVQETAVERTKFSTPEAPKPAPRVMPQELPYGYAEDKAVLQVRDSYWLHIYWEVTAAVFNRLKGQFGDIVFSAKRVLRVYDVSHILFNGTNAHRFFDIVISPETNNWYIDTGSAGRSWCVDIGLLLSDGRFITLVRSNTVHTPIEGASWITDEEWMIPEEMFARLYGMGFGLGQSSPVGKAWQERIRRELFSGILSSPGIASMASPVKKKVPGARKFWLVVNTELIVYGATEPDAKVDVQGKEIKLRPDGTFSLRFALPDGKQVIPVHAVSSDGIDERTITPIVNKETK